MRVIGTAGHVDHGKSTLIAALTGIHPDRLKEEQARAMTIELGFGWFTLPNGEEVGIVDVPGHRDFIENMLSGIGGIDAALLIIAADEGVMPQTREHLAILDLLQIPAGLIVLTKIDLVSDSAWLDLLETDIRGVVSETLLKDVPIIRVSAKTKVGLDILIIALSKILEAKSPRVNLNRPRLPIDRVFSMSGFGTIVTGTLRDGNFAVGDEIEILPSGLQGRIRGLQTHKKKEEIALSGSRTAMNISGVNTELINRGDVVAHLNQYTATRRIDARFRLLKNASSSIKHGDEAKFFVGASEGIATIRLIGTEKLNPGEEAWIQLELRDPIVTVRGDRYILRRPSPSETLGGGSIIDHQPKGRHKRFDKDILNSLELLTQGTPANILLEAAIAINIGSTKDVVAKSRLEASNAQAALDELIQKGQLIVLEIGEPKITSDLLIIASSQWTDLKKRIENILDLHHKQFPLRRGISREELKSKLKTTPRIYTAIITRSVQENILIDGGNWLANAGHEIRFNQAEQAQVQKLMRKFELNPYSTPSVKECQNEVGEEVVNALLELKQLVAVSSDVIFRSIDYDEMVEKLRLTIQQKGQVSLAEVRDLFKTTRKYAQALLEYMDSTGITIRDGDFRRLRI